MIMFRNSNKASPATRNPFPNPEPIPQLIMQNYMKNLFPFFAKYGDPHPHPIAPQGIILCKQRIKMRIKKLVLLIKWQYLEIGNGEK